MAAIVLEPEWVVDRVLLLHIRCATAVLEIVDFFIAHESVLNTAKIDPDILELVVEKRPGVQILLSVTVFPPIAG